MHPHGAAHCLSMPHAKALGPQSRSPAPPTCRGLSQKGHLPAKCSVRMANMRSTEPSTARCTMTGRSRVPDSEAYSRPNLGVGAAGVGDSQQG